ncbi:hypothetical protein [Algibacter pectinivorans]|uniref:Uncharacterized protein n=1 Tax=Algibacter pectinivorans TaxID=870482 RepID=A0A1I1R0E9_9FLAO|nr:hypothetical protein [Algibacter pectinivorans]SFD27809.1 hypothetical protein SAMN04487987_10846 [Algibacter pectinivorans]
MKINLVSFLLFVSSLLLNAQSTKFTTPIIDNEVIFQENNGMVAVEAEYFNKQSKFEHRQWYITSKNAVSNVGSDEDAPHHINASNDTYIEILPDTRITHSDKLVQGENFSNKAGEIGILHYKVRISNPGRYYVWVRAFSTGSEDNGLHVGLNGAWPKNGQRMQWCEGKNKWTWESKQRTKEEHCGIAKEIYLDIEKAGVHDIQFSMREDGFEFDKFILTKDSTYTPKGEGLKVTTLWPMQSYYKQIAASNIENKTLPIDDFPIKGTGFYKHAEGKWLGINPNKQQEAQTTTPFTFKNGNYDLVFVAVGENDGQSEFTIRINNKKLGTFKPPLTKDLFEEGESNNALWENVKFKKGDKITVIAKIGSADGKEWARARWSGIIFAPVGKGKEVIKTPYNGAIKVAQNTAPVIKAPKGRIAVVADGNSPDPDDLGGTAISLALLRATGLENTLVHYSHSCDIVRVNRISEKAEIERHALMQSVCDVTARRWGGFDGLKFLDAKWNIDETIKDLAKAINASTAEDPLWIIEAGEPDIIGFALDASSKDKHKHVKVITHHPANDDAGDFYTWQQILDFGVEEVRIPDQNIKLKVNIAEWDWARDHKDPRLQQVWLFGKMAEVDDVVKFQKGKWDCSDAGMILYWITGANLNNGLKQGTVDDVKNILLNYIAKN